MKVRGLLLWSAAALILVAAWLLAPVYQSFAYRGVFPLPPWGWVHVATPAPETQVLLDRSFEGWQPRSESDG